MPLNTGWVKLHRSIEHSNIASNYNLTNFFIRLLLRANFKKVEKLVDGKMITYEPGQIVTSIRKLSDDFGIDRKTIRRYLERLHMVQMVDHLRDHRGTVITICNWSKYQGNESDVGTTDGTTHGTTHGTQKKKEKKEKNENINLCREETSQHDAAPIILIFDKYLTICKDRFKRRPILTSDRKKRISILWKKYPDMEIWVTTFENMSASDFHWGLTGNRRQYSLSWILKTEENFIKTYEGNYVDSNKVVEIPVNYKRL